MVETVIVENEIVQDGRSEGPAVSWPAIAAGALVTLAGALLLLALGSGLGFSVISPWPGHGSYAGETTKAATVAGIYLTATSVLASAVGGYLAGRMRSRWAGIPAHEAFFRDAAHGLISWAAAVVVGVALLGTAAGGLSAGGAMHAAALVAGPGVTGESSGPLAEYADRLFAYDTGAISQGRAAPDGRELTADRAMAERLLLQAVAQGGALAEGEQQRLAAIVAARTGMALPDADKRVAMVLAEARPAADLARRVAARLSFWLVASMFAGALASSLAAWEGGAIRDGRLKYAS